MSYEPRKRGRMSFRILIAASDFIWRTGLERLISEQNKESPVMVCTSRRECLAALNDFNPEIFIVRCSNQGMCCMELIQRIFMLNKKARVIMVGEAMDVVTARKLMDAGVLGLLGNVQNTDQLKAALRNVARGIRYIDDIVASLLADKEAPANETLFASLTQREFQVFNLILDGKQTVEIASMLSMSGKTVANHHSAILRKLGVGNNIELTKLALRHNMTAA
ncbi:MAG: response regulator transcription factor [Mariprofundaceae bacterium]|nr:response regulator transcription factor [Mariprofundaceae bacterium]